MISFKQFLLESLDPYARHAELERKYNEGTITPDEIEEAERIVERVAISAGYVENVYHGTLKHFTKFRKKLSGIWTAFDPIHAEPGSGEVASIKMNLYADPGNKSIHMSEDDIEKWRHSSTPLKWIQLYLAQQYYKGDVGRVTSVHVGNYALVLDNPSQLKSAEPFTGVPLEKRFNTNSEKITESVDTNLLDLDKEYLAAVERGDMETAQRMVDEAAKRAGYNVGPVWRGDAGDKRTNILDPRRKKDAYDNGPATLFATNKKLADYYDENDDARPFYLMSNKPMVEDVGEGYRGGHWSRIRDIVMYAINMGHDSVLVQDVTDGPGIRGDVWGTLSSHQHKLALPVTYDEQGNIIPLSKRFNPQSNSIKESRKLSQKDLLKESIFSDTPTDAIHFGDGGVGRDTTNRRMTFGRSTGHFGTGIYFFGKEAAEQLHGRINRPMKYLDLTNLKLFRPQNPLALHNVLRLLNNTIRKAEPMVFDDYSSDGRKIKFNLWMEVGLKSKISEEKIEELLRKVESMYLGKDPSENFATPSTEIMRLMGYDGIDVRGTEMDNGDYGSVVFVTNVRESRKLSQKDLLKESTWSFFPRKRQ